MAWNFCTKEDVTSMHPINEADLPDSWSDFVEGLIIQYKGNKYLGDPTAITDEYHNGDGSDIVFVRNPPIISVESVQVNGSVLSASDYIVFPSYIQLKNLYFTKARANVKLSYTSGTAIANIDTNVRFCATVMIIAIANYKARMGSDSSIVFGTAPTREGEPSVNFNLGLISNLKAIMKAVLRRDKVRVG